jgi:DNA modification methylase
MFSFTGDTVLDPFCGTATTMGAAHRIRRRSEALAGREQKSEILFRASFRLRQSSYGATSMSSATKTGKSASIRG